MTQLIPMTMIHSMSTCDDSRLVFVAIPTVSGVT
jgi:hypothetical protein